MKRFTISASFTRYFTIGIVLFLYVSSSIAQELDSNVPIGWAAVPGNKLGTTTGGGNGNIVTATSVTELSEYASSSEPLVILVQGRIKGNGMINVKSNKTILGQGADARLSGVGLNMNGVSNIIIRNLKITGAVDGIAARQTHHLWVDHCEIWDCSDGLLDITRESSFATVSWCKFFYLSQVDHRLACLIGSGGGDHPEDWGRLKVTYHHNWYGDRVISRMPRVMYGQAHIFNDYYTSAGNDYCIGVGSYGSALIEKNYFKDVNDPHVFMYDVYSWITARDNIYVNTSGKKANGKGGGRDVGVAGWSFPVVAFDTPPYLYAMDEAENIPSLVSNGAGPNPLNGEIDLMPQPGQGAVVEGENTVLQWTKGTVGSTALSYNVYFGTSANPPQVGTTIEQTFHPGELSPGIVYYWRVDQVTSGETIIGKVWRFHTEEPSFGRPFVAISSPSPDTSFSAPSIISIKADASDLYGVVSSVEFFEGSTSIGIDNTHPYSITWDNVSGGTYMLTAKVTDNDGDSFTSEPISITVEKVTGVADQPGKMAMLYPNPVSGELKLNMKDSYSGTTHFVLFNSLGKVIMKETFTGREHTINFKDVPNGVYIVTLTNKKENMVRRIIKD